jgi:protocatechuate 3,4-dioxygenase beta subunit
VTDSPNRAVTPGEHLAQVVAAYANSPNARLAEITTSLITHLHQFIVEVGMTREEWFSGIQFLTRAGQMSNGHRQEFILLSDTLGISMLVEMINHAPVAGSTEPTVFGPFHVDDAPERALGESIVVNPMVQDEPIVFSGRVLGLNGNPIAGARLDVWETASNGLYDVQDEGQSAMNMRGIFTTGDDGAYVFVGVRPVPYQIPGDGPAGDLLFANGRQNWRPGHVHFRIAAPGHKTVITHLFDAASAHLESDTVFGVRPSLVIEMSGGVCEYDFVLEPVG